MISIIICTVDPVRTASITKHYTQIMGDEPFELITIRDAKSMCEGYNRGLAQSKGDLIIFSHDDVEIWEPDLPGRIKSLLSEWDIIGVAGTTRLIAPVWGLAGPPYIFGVVPHTAPDNRFDVCIFGAPCRVVPKIQALDGLFIACTRKAALVIPWDSKTFTGFHLYDIDWSFRAHLNGLKIAVINDLTICHQSHGTYGEDWTEFAKAFARKHLFKIQPMLPRGSHPSIVNVGTKKEALEVATILASYFAD